jgi:hypothetical protein
MNRLSEELQARAGVAIRSVGARLQARWGVGLPMIARGYGLQSMAVRSHGARHNRRGERAEGRECYLLAAQLRRLELDSRYLWANEHLPSTAEVLDGLARARRVSARSRFCRENRGLTRLCREHAAFVAWEAQDANATAGVVLAAHGAGVD